MKALHFSFDTQSDTEKHKGLPVTPFMDRDKVAKPSSQTNFIRFVLLPLFTELTKLFPRLEVQYCTAVDGSNHEFVGFRGGQISHNVNFDNPKRNSFLTWRLVATFSTMETSNLKVSQNLPLLICVILNIIIV